jgi:hypothetical protein
MTAIMDDFQNWVSSFVRVKTAGFKTALNQKSYVATLVYCGGLTIFAILKAVHSWL